MKPRRPLLDSSAALPGHCAPKPMPNSGRNRDRNLNAGEQLAMNLHSECQAVESITGFFRPIRPASQPDAVAPNYRIHSVKSKLN